MAKVGGFNKKEVLDFCNTISDNYIKNLENNLKNIGYELYAIEGFNYKGNGTPCWNGANACKWLKAALKNYDNNIQLIKRIDEVNDKLLSAVKKSQNK